MARYLMGAGVFLAGAVVVFVTSGQAPVSIDQPQATSGIATSAGGEVGMTSARSRFTITTGDRTLVNTPMQGVGSNRFRLTEVRSRPAEVEDAGPVHVAASMTRDAHGLPVIAYRDDRAEHLAVVTCGDSMCRTRATRSIVDSAGGRGVSLALGPEGLPVIAYVGYSGLKLATCGTPTCEAGITIAFVDAVGNRDVNPSLAIGADGFPVMAYRDPATANLKVAKCNTGTCNRDTVLTMVDATGSVGSVSSMTIGADGLPLIAYRDDATADLKVAKCGTPSCSAGNLIAAVDLAHQNVGTHLALAIGPQGVPVIWYQALGTRDVNRVACGNASCTAGNTMTAVDAARQPRLVVPLVIDPEGVPVRPDARVGPLAAFSEESL